MPKRVDIVDYREIVSPMDFFSFLNNLRFRYKLLLMSGASMVLLSSGLMLNYYWSMKRLSKEIGQTGQEILADKTERFLSSNLSGQADAIDLQMEQARAAVIIGSQSITNDIQANRLPSSKQFEKLLENGGPFSTTVYLALPDRKPTIYPNPPEHILGKESSTFYSKKLKELNATTIKTGNPQWSRIHSNPIAPAYDRIIDVIVPIQVNDETAGILGISISVIRLIAQFNHRQAIRGSYSFILDKQVRLIAGPPHGVVDLRSPQTRETERGIIDLSGTDSPSLKKSLLAMALGSESVDLVVINNHVKYLAIKPLKNADLRIGLVVPFSLATIASEQMIDVIDNRGKSALFSMLLISIFLLGITLLVVALISIRISNPLKELTAAANQISHGRIEQTIPIRSKDEMGFLAESFNKMSRQLKEKIESLNAEIAQRKLIDQKLARARALLTAAVEQSPAGILIAEAPDVKIILANSAAMGIRGDVGSPLTDTPASLHLNDWQAFYPDETPFSPEDLPLSRAVMKGETTKNIEVIIKQVSGEARWVLANAGPVMDQKGNIIAGVAVFHDITARKEAERALKQRLDQLQSIYDTLPVVVWSLDKKGVFTMSEGLELGSFGIKPGEVVGLSAFDLYKNYPDIVDHIDKGLSGEFCEYESEVMGNIYHSILTPVFDENNHVVGLNGLAVNITEKKKVEEEIRQLRNYLSNIINSMPSVLIGVDAYGDVTQWNSEAYRITGVSFNNAIGRPLQESFPRLTSAMGKVRQAINSKQVLSDSRQPYKENGEMRYEDITIYPLVTNGVEGAVIRLDDVTERVRIEEMMVQSEKMLSVGGLAAGMAHEINNPLAGMIQTTAVMIDRLTDSQLQANLNAADSVGVPLESIVAYMKLRGIPGMLGRIRESGSRAANIVDNMLSFARKSDTIHSEHDPVELLERCVELAGSDYDLKKKYDFRQIKIVREYEEKLPLIPCEPSKIQQVFLNILRNGAEAMLEKEDSASCFVLRMALEQPNQMIRIEIEDNGPGMDKETRKRVFEPFYTTKPTDRGTGLGLSVSYFIITENHGGEMRVESSPGKGTVFIIKLPVTRQEDFECLTSSMS